MFFFSAVDTALAVYKYRMMPVVAVDAFAFAYGVLLQHVFALEYDAVLLRAVDVRRFLLYSLQIKDRLQSIAEN